MTLACQDPIDPPSPAGGRVSRQVRGRRKPARSSWPRLTGVLLSVAVLAACSAPGAKPPPLTKITVANPSAAAPGAVLQVIKDAGLYEKNGLDVSLQVVNGAPQLLASLLSGNIAIAMQGASAVLQAQLSGADIVMFAGLVNTTFFTLFSKPELTSVADLKGKKIGSTPGNGNDQATVDLLLARFGLKPTDVQIVSLPQNSRIPALQNGAVDAIVITSPFTTQARKLGMHELVDVGSMHLEYQSSAFVTSRSYLRDHRDVVLRFARALSQGIKFYKTNKDASLKSLATFTKLDDPDALNETYDLFALKYTSKVPYLSVPGLQYVYDNVVSAPNKKDHQVTEFIDQSVIKQLEDEGLYRQLWGNDSSGV